jgi:hypothetical protein
MNLTLFPDDNLTRALCILVVVVIGFERFREFTFPVHAGD